MKKTLAATAVWLGVIAATATTVNTMTLTLPFAASLGGVTLPAGEYTIRDMHMPV
jgi:hypothetical protein